MSDEERLKGWKEIGDFLHVSDRTVQRWQRLGLPVHRVATARKAIVFADAAELRLWMQSPQGRVARGGKPAELATPGSTSREESTNVVESIAQAGSAKSPGRWRRPLPRYLALVLLVGGTMAIPVAPWRSWLRGPVAEVSSRSVTSSRDGRIEDACSGQRTLLLNVRLSDGSEARVGVKPGALATYKFGDRPPVAIAASCQDQRAVLRFYEVNAAPTPHHQLRELAAVRLLPGEGTDITPASLFAHVSWVVRTPAGRSRGR